MVDVIHVHEDDWGIRTLHPLTALAEVEADIARAAAAAERTMLEYRAQHERQTQPPGLIRKLLAIFGPAR